MIPQNPSKGDIAIMGKKLIVLDPGHGQFGNEYPILKRSRG